MACNTLFRLRDTSIDPELRSEYHDEVCDLTHSRLIESMFLDCADIENEPQPRHRTRIARSSRTACSTGRGGYDSP